MDETPHPTSVGWSPTTRNRIGFLLLALGLLTATDLALDLADISSSLHVATEILIVVVALSAAGIAARDAWAARRALRTEQARALQLDQALDAARSDATRWRDEAASLLRGLSEAIDLQLERWGLTPAEKEVALLLLKGLSHKEIAGIRGVGEATVRQQAGTIYRKADLQGRNDLAAFFLEDLLTPRTLDVTRDRSVDPLD